MEYIITEHGEVIGKVKAPSPSAAIAKYLKTPLCDLRPHIAISEDNERAVLYGHRMLGASPIEEAQGGDTNE